MKQYSEEELNLLAQVLPNVATQLRGAMANVYTAAKLLVPEDARDADEKTDRIAAAFSQSYYQMYRVIGNLNDAAFLAETTPFVLYNDDIVGLCRGVCEKVEGLFDLSGVTLDFTADCDSRIIGMDAERMERLLLNLLSNALKFTPRGGKVSVSVKPADAVCCSRSRIPAAASPPTGSTPCLTAFSTQTALTPCRTASVSVSRCAAASRRDTAGALWQNPRRAGAQRSPWHCQT